MIPDLHKEGGDSNDVREVRYSSLDLLSFLPSEFVDPDNDVETLVHPIHIVPMHRQSNWHLQPLHQYFPVRSDCLFSSVEKEQEDKVQQGQTFTLK